MNWLTGFKGATNYALQLLLVIALLSLSMHVAAHGSVVEEGDGCLIRFGFYSAHFTIFQPASRQHQEFCEDIPEVSESVFVMEYLHNSLREVPVDFRIIRDNHKRGRFVKWADIVALGDLQEDTVFYQPPLLQVDGVFSVLYSFTAPGDYIGIVTAPHPTEELVYHAVFPFRVGGVNWFSWPLIISLLVLVQLLYWWMNGSLTSRRFSNQGRIDSQS